jgi:hypothetical protein
MILTLSRRAQQTGQKRLLRQAVTNAFGFGFTTGPVVALLAMHYGASDLQTGFLYAGVHLCGFAGLIAPAFLNGRETTAIWSRFWWTRAVVSFGYLLLPLLPTDVMRVWALLGLYYCFMMARSVGLTAAFPTQKAICGPNRLPEILASNFTRTQASLLVVQMTSFLLAGSGWFQSDEPMLLILISIGAVSNAITSWLISRFPPTGYLEEGSLQGVYRAARELLRTPSYRETAIMVSLQTGLAVCLGYHINFLRRGLELPSDRIFLVVMVGFLGAITISQAMRVAASRVPVRAQLMVIHLLLMLTGLLWAFILRLPVGDSLPLLLLASFPVQTAAAAMIIVLHRLQADNLPSGRSVQTSALYQIIAVVGALVSLGLINASMGLDALSRLPGAHDYTGPFLVWAVLALACGVFDIFLKALSQKEPLLGQLATLLPGNLASVYRAYRIEQERDPRNARVALEGLMSAPTLVSRQILLEGLHDRDVTKRMVALRAATRTSIPEALPPILAEATDPLAPLRREALTALGFLGNRYAADHLRPLLDDPSPAVRAGALKSLLRLGIEVEDATVDRVFDACDGTRERVDVFIGLAEARRRPKLLELVGRVLNGETKPSPLCSEALLQFAAAAWDLRETMVEIFDAEASAPGAGIEAALAEAEGGWPDGLDPEAVRCLAAGERYDELAARLRRHLPDSGWIAIHDRSTALGVLLLWLALRGESA